MGRQSNIVSFDEALRNARRRAAARSSAASSSPSSSSLKEGSRASSKSEKQDEQEEKQATFSERLNSKREAKKRARKKAKAERKFEKTYGGEKGLGTGSFNSSKAAAEDAGPRAALYAGKMGSKAKRVSKIQEKASGIAAGATGILAARAPKHGSADGDHASRNFSLARIPRSARIAVTALVCLGIFLGCLYVPAQQCYNQMRERDRLAAEYAAVQSRNDELVRSVNKLQTNEGIEDRAQTEFGYVKNGWDSAGVIGIKVVDTSKFTANVAPGSVPAPETWYSPVLDLVFGYKNG